MCTEIKIADTSITLKSVCLFILSWRETYKIITRPVEITETNISFSIEGGFTYHRHTLNHEDIIGVADSENGSVVVSNIKFKILNKELYERYKNVQKIHIEPS